MWPVGSSGSGDHLLVAATATDLEFHGGGELQGEAPADLHLEGHAPTTDQGRAIVFQLQEDDQVHGDKPEHLHVAPDTDGGDEMECRPASRANEKRRRESQVYSHAAADGAERELQARRGGDSDHER